MSNQVLWELTKRNNAFLVNRYGVKLSSDPYNPTGRNLQSHSGFIQQQAVAITATKPVAKKVNLTQIGLGFKKRARHLLKNKTAFKKAKGDHYVSFHRENLNVKAGVHRAARVIRKKYENRRPGLAKLALRKLVLIHKANLIKKVKARRERVNHKKTQ